MRHHFQAEQWVPYPRERVFAFFADPKNLPPLMPPWQHTRIVKAQLTAEYAAEGSVMVISFRPVPLMPLRMEWEARIVEFRWGDYFCDEQRRGPFKYFRHCHRVTDAEQGGCIVSDNVDYELPFGLPGLLVKGQIKTLFAHRQKMLPMLLEQSFSKSAQQPKRTAGI